jgi:hypothetical protein
MEETISGRLGDGRSLLKAFLERSRYLRKTAGLIQIRDDAEAISRQQLLVLDREVKRLLKEAKESFNPLPRGAQGIHYFGSQSERQEDASEEKKIQGLPV